MSMIVDLVFAFIIACGSAFSGLALLQWCPKVHFSLAHLAFNNVADGAAPCKCVIQDGSHWKIWKVR